jgi:hypothetical protein
MPEDVHRMEMSVLFGGLCSQLPRGEQCLLTPAKELQEFAIVTHRIELADRGLLRTARCWS